MDGWLAYFGSRDAFTAAKKEQDQHDKDMAAVAKAVRR